MGGFNPRRRIDYELVIQRVSSSQCVEQVIGILCGPVRTKLEGSQGKSNENETVSHTSTHYNKENDSESPQRDRTAFCESLLSGRIDGFLARARLVGELRVPLAQFEFRRLGRSQW